MRKSQSQRSSIVLQRVTRQQLQTIFCINTDIRPQISDMAEDEERIREYEERVQLETLKR